MSMILDVNTQKRLNALPRLSDGGIYCNYTPWKKLLRKEVSKENDIFFLIKANQDGMTDNWQIYQIVSDKKKKVIDFLDKNYDEYEIIFSCSINKVYRI